MPDASLPPTMIRRATAFAPGSIGNVGPGLDVLGMAVAGAGDTVTAEATGGPDLVVVEAGHPSLSSDPAHHASALAADAVRRLTGRAGFGAALRVIKGLPLSGGQGGSAASAAAGAGAMNALLGSPLDRSGVIAAALEAESRVAGRHADNIAASILGGLALVRSLDPLDCICLPAPEGLFIVLAHPHMELRTAEGRAALPGQVPRAIAIHQMAQTAAIVAACCLDDLALLGRAIDDRLAEPARAPLLRGFAEARQAAARAGALGCSISGSGPTAFAFAPDQVTAERIAAAMQAAYGAAGLECDTRVTTPDRQGLKVDIA